MNTEEIIHEAKARLIETGGHTSQDIGIGRIVGQIMVYLYLQEEESSLDSIESELGLSKASVSIAVRQLEQLGLVRKVWKKGDRKSYYRSAENIYNAFQQGMVSFIRKKVQSFGDELENINALLKGAEENAEHNQQLDFLIRRVERARKIQQRLDWIIGNPLLKLLTRVK